MYYPRLIHVQFVVYKITLGQAYLQLLLFSPFSIISPVLYTHSFICHWQALQNLSSWQFCWIIWDCHHLPVPYHWDYIFSEWPTDSIMPVMFMTVRHFQKLLQLLIWPKISCLWNCSHDSLWTNNTRLVIVKIFIVDTNLTVQWNLEVK